MELIKEFSKIGGIARAASMLPERRTEVARHAAEVRWKGKKESIKIGPSKHRLKKEKERLLRKRLEKWGLTEETLDMEVCQICKQKPVNRNLCIDHDHTTEKFRGLLCNNCNTGLGMFKDSCECLQSAIKYLDKARAEHKMLEEEVRGEHAA